MASYSLLPLPSSLPTSHPPLFFLPFSFFTFFNFLFSASSHPFSSCSSLYFSIFLLSLPLHGTCVQIPSGLLSHWEPEEPGQAWLMMVASFLLGVKAGARPGGIPGAPAGQPGADGESVLSKILPGGAAEQAGKLTEGERCLQPGPGGQLLQAPAEVGPGE